MTDEEPRRQTAAERAHEVTMTILQRSPAPPESSVELTRNAKGDVQIGVTVRGHDAETVEGEAVAIFDRLCQKYPRNDLPAAAAALKGA